LSWEGPVPESGFAAAVVDGMGGYAGGAEAAALVAGTLARANLGAIEGGWDGWFEHISAQVTQAGKAWHTPEMGATAALLAITPGGMIMTNVGDCRIYRVVGPHLGQISVDDRTDMPDSSAITQALGGSIRIDSHCWQQDFTVGVERYVLCSDGVWGTLETPALREMCTANQPPGELVDAVAAAIYDLNSTDNGSILVVDVYATPVEPSAPAPPPAQPVRQSVWPIAVQSHTADTQGKAPQ